VPASAVSTRVSGGRPAAWAGVEDDVPPRRAYAETSLVVFEVMAHVQFAESTPHSSFRMRVVQGEMHGVVDDVTKVKAGGHGPRESCSDNRNEQAEKQQRERIEKAGGSTRRRGSLG
jgi:hypothetical protein